MEFFSASLTLWANIPYLPYFNLQLKGDIKDQIKGKQMCPSTIIHTHTRSHTLTATVQLRPFLLEHLWSMSDLLPFLLRSCCWWHRRRLADVSVLYNHCCVHFTPCFFSPCSPSSFTKPLSRPPFILRSSAARLSARSQLTATNSETLREVAGSRCTNAV